MKYGWMETGFIQQTVYEAFSDGQKFIFTITNLSSLDHLWLSNDQTGHKM